MRYSRMLVLLAALACALWLLFFSPLSADSGVVSFTPPKGWSYAEDKKLPPSVRVMVVGKGPSSVPPSMNLSTQPFDGTLKDYLKLVKDINEKRNDQWKDLGTIRTNAGVASLSQVDSLSEWGQMRQMHAILLKGGQIYILTAGALKEEFPLFYKDFFAAFRSLNVMQNPFEMVPIPPQRAQLKVAAEGVKSKWTEMMTQAEATSPTSPLGQLKEELFYSDAFQTDVWKPFAQMVQQKYGTLGVEWQTLLLSTLRMQLFEIDLPRRNP